MTPVMVQRRCRLVTGKLKSWGVVVFILKQSCLHNMLQCKAEQSMLEVGAPTCKCVEEFTLASSAEDALTR